MVRTGGQIAGDNGDNGGIQPLNLERENMLNFVATSRVFGRSFKSTFSWPCFSIQWVQLKNPQKTQQKLPKNTFWCFFFYPIRFQAKFFYFGQEARVFCIGSLAKGRKFLPTKIVKKPRDELLSFEKH